MKHRRRTGSYVCRHGIHQAAGVCINVRASGTGDPGRPVAEAPFAVCKDPSSRTEQPVARKVPSLITRRFTHAVDLCATAITAALVVAAAASSRADEAGPTIDIGDRDIGGVVTGPAGPEVGVWVIAETSDLATKFAKVVVTDERGRYMVPDLPKAKLQPVGARLRTHRSGESSERARPSRQSHGSPRAD